MSFAPKIALPNSELKASWERFDLQFKTPAKTSRETFKTKDTYVLKVWETANPNTIGLGECAPLWTLSIDDPETFTQILDQVCSEINNWAQLLQNPLIQKYPSIRFGIESALLDLMHGGKQIYFPSKFTEGKDTIQINGLIWMGDFDSMAGQIESKIQDGFSCVKLKIGAIDWDQEIELLTSIRTRFSKDEIELRVDANGAFEQSSALNKLEELAKLDIHSIEQPILAGNWKKMAELCEKTPLPIALDEELIGIHDFSQKKLLLETIRPQYLIFKPSLLGGIEATNEWIALCDQMEIKWWVTSALEGNIGLNAIAQYTYQTGNKMPQGLGTGQLFTNNFDSILRIKNDSLKSTWLP